jgi:nitroreductase
MIDKAVDVSAPVHELITNRWSGVSYDPEREVSDDDLRAMAEAARWAPSCFGDEPWRVLFCNRASDQASWQKAFDCLAEGNQPWCQHAPVLVIICADTQFSQNDKPNGWCEYDTGAAALSICLQARHLGMMTHQMAGFDPEAARTVFAIPERIKPIAMMTIGYQANESKIPDQFRDRELAPRKRNALGEHFYLGGWGEAL